MNKILSAFSIFTGLCICAAVSFMFQAIPVSQAAKAADTVNTDCKADTAAYNMTNTLFQQRKAGQNLIFSPYSVQQILSLIADNTTQKDAQRELKPYLIPDICNEQLDNTKTGSLILLDKSLSSVTTRKTDDAFRLVNYPDEALQAKEDFQKQVLGSVIDSDAPKKHLTFLTAAHYYAEWATKFNKKLTANRPFTTEDGQAISVTTMKQHFPTGNGKITSDYEMAAVPGKNNSVVYFIKPKINKNAAANELGTIISDFEQGKDTVRNIDLEVPKISVKNKLDLEQLLKSLKLPSFFNGRLYFDNITGKMPYVLAEASQTATLDINEDYAEGKAVTEIGFRAMSAPIRIPLTEIKMDSPYFIVIKDKTAAGISRVVFTAWIANPTT